MFLGSKMHISTLFICLVELVFFFYQLIYYLSRTSDKNRLYYLILLFLLIQYNIISDALPDKNFSLSIDIQVVLVYFTAIIMAMYLPFYFYRVFSLDKLRFYAYWGSIWFLFLPFLLLFIIPYFITGNLDLSIKLLTIAPFFYAISFFGAMVKVIIEKYKDRTKDGRYKEEIIGAIAIWFWILLPIRAFFRREIETFLTPYLDFEGRGTALIIILTNIGLLVLTILFVRQNIRQSKSEYLELLESKRKLQEKNAELLESEKKLQEKNAELLESKQMLQEMNTELIGKVKERTRELEIANEQRTNAFINLAHDLKTPLTLINNYLEDYSRETPANASLNLIRVNIGKLTTNIINFFDSERIKKGITIYDHSLVSDLSAILKDNVEIFKNYSSKKGILITHSIQDGVFVLIDPYALNRIINNIIENAIKYTDVKGTIDISLECKGNQVCFTVKDNGMGIPEELCNKVFDPFYQYNSKKANYQGMGLGLSITKSIVDTVNGEIKITSNPSQRIGTKVTVYLKSHAVISPQEINAYKSTTKVYEQINQLLVKDDIHNSDLPTILIVEDNIEMINYIGNKLCERYNIYIAQSGNEATEKLKGIKHLNLIISDVMMNNGDGFEFYKKVVQQKKFRHIPFIFVTAKKDEKIQGLSLGAIDYIFKPFLIAELIQKIESVLNNLSEQRRAIIDSFHNSIIQNDQLSEISHQNNNKITDNWDKFNLTIQERKIIVYIEEGLSNRSIGENLSISENTVKSHLQNIFKKVGVVSRLELLKKLEIRK